MCVQSKRPARSPNRPVLLGNRRIPQRHQIARKGGDVGLARQLHVLVIQHARHRLGGPLLEDKLPCGCTSLHDRYSFNSRHESGQHRQNPPAVKPSIPQFS